MSPFYDSVLDLKFDVLEKSAFVLDVAVLVTTFTDTGTGTDTRIAVVSSVAAADSYITVVAFAAVFVTADTTGAVLAVAGSANCSASLGNRSKKLFIFQPRVFIFKNSIYATVYISYARTLHVYEMSYHCQQ